MTKSDKHTLLLYYIHTHVTKVVSSNYMSLAVITCSVAGQLVSARVVRSTLVRQEPTTGSTEAICFGSARVLNA